MRFALHRARPHEPFRPFFWHLSKGRTSFQSGTDKVPVMVFSRSKHLMGVTIATGESTQIVTKGRVTSRLIFRFKDGSVDEDVTVFTQEKVFRLVSDHHIQHGPSFPKPIDFVIDMPSGYLTFKAEDGSISREHMDLPPDGIERASTEPLVEHPSFDAGDQDLLRCAWQEGPPHPCCNQADGNPRPLEWGPFAERPRISPFMPNWVE